MTLWDWSLYLEVNEINDLVGLRSIPRGHDGLLTPRLMTLWCWGLYLEVMVEYQVQGQWPCEAEVYVWKLWWTNKTNVYTSCLCVEQQNVISSAHDLDLSSIKHKICVQICLHSELIMGNTPRRILFCKCQNQHMQCCPTNPPHTRTTTPGRCLYMSTSKEFCGPSDQDDNIEHAQNKRGALHSEPQTLSFQTPSFISCHND